MDSESISKLDYKAKLQSMFKYHCRINMKKYWQKDYETASGLLVDIDGEVYEGEFLKKKAHGKEKYCQKDGRIYNGYWQNDKKHKYGQEIFIDESKYEGQFAKGQRTGLETQIYFYEQGNLQSFRNMSKYLGEWNNNQISGYGTIFYNNGSFYIGFQINNQRDGYGEYIKSNGDVYKGYWKNDQYSDNGSNKSKKQVQIGQFQNDELSGHGTKLIHCGQFINNQRHGHGVQINQNQSSYKGFWMNDRAEGNAIFKNQLIDQIRVASFNQEVYTNRWQHKGLYIDDKQQGTGIDKFINSDSYIGGFSENQFNGEGTYVWKMGEIYSGSWSNDKRTGVGCQIDKNSSYYEGFWVDDKRQGVGMDKFITGDKYIGGFSEHEQNDEGIHIWRTGEIYSGIINQQITYQLPCSNVTIIDLSPDNIHLVFAQNLIQSRYIIIYNVKLRQLVGSWRAGHKDGIMVLKYSPNGSLIASGGDAFIRIWNSQTQKQVSNTLKGHQKRVLSLAFSTNTDRLASGSLDHSIRIWDWQKGITLFILKPECGYLQQLMYSNDGIRLMFGSKHKIGIFDNLQCQPIEKFKVKAEKENIMISSNDNGRSIYFSRSDNGKLIYRLVTKVLRSLAHLPYRKSVAFHSRDQLCLVDITTRKTLRIFKDYGDGKLKYSTDSKYLLLVNYEGNISIQPLYFF